MTVKIGVLALQGGVKEHLNQLNKIDQVKGVPIKKAEELKSCQGLILPGGESSTLKKLINKYHFKKAILNFHDSNKKIWGSCAGLIILAKEIENEESSLGLLDIKVKRNVFGSQLNSFIYKAKIPAISKHKIEQVFIRAPIITETAPDIKILASYKEQTTAVESKNILATSFHPELTDDLSVHKYFVNKSS